MYISHPVNKNSGILHLVWAGIHIGMGSHSGGVGDVKVYHLRPDHNFCKHSPQAKTIFHYCLLFVQNDLDKYVSILRSFAFQFKICCYLAYSKLNVWMRPILAIWAINNKCLQLWIHTEGVQVEMEWKTSHYLATSLCSMLPHYPLLKVRHHSHLLPLRVAHSMRLCDSKGLVFFIFEAAGSCCKICWLCVPQRLISFGSFFSTD